MSEFEAEIRSHFLYLTYAPIVYVSAKTKQRLHTLPELIREVHSNHALRVSSALLNDILLDAVATNPTPTDKGRRLKIYYITQVAIQPPTFVVFVNDKELMHFSYERFLENQLRHAFEFTGTPIRIITRERN